MFSVFCSGPMERRRANGKRRPWIRSTQALLVPNWATRMFERSQDPIIDRMCLLSLFMYGLQIAAEPAAEVLEEEPEVLALEDGASCKKPKKPEFLKEVTSEKPMYYIDFLTRAGDAPLSFLGG